MRLVLKTAPCPAAEVSNCVKEKDKFILYRDLKSGYRWRMRSPSGETLATSPSGYPEKSTCEEGSLYAPADTDANNVTKV